MRCLQRWMGGLLSFVLLLVTSAPLLSAVDDWQSGLIPDEPASSRVQSAPVGPPTPQDGGPWVVRAYYTGEQMVRDLAAWNEPWELNRDARYVVVEVDVDAYARLLAAGFRVEIDVPLTMQLRQPNVALPEQIAGIPGYPCYRTVEETFAAAEAIAAEYPHLATWIDIGDSWEKIAPEGQPGYDMMVLRLTNAVVPGPKPALFVMSSVHAREYTSAELSTRFAESLVANYGVDADVTWILDHHEIHLLLQANPDGRKQAETGLSWRKNTNGNYCSPTSNNRGADLNRNYAFQWGCCGGSSGYPCDGTYRGEWAASEPETQAVQNYVRANFPDQRADDLTAAAPLTATGIFLDLHSYSELVLWSWGFTASPPPNSAGLRTLGRKFAYFNGYTPDQAMSLYPTDGTTDDFAYGELGLAAYTFELGTAFFQSCSVFENTILPDNMPALLYAAKAARTPYMTPSGPDALSVTALPGAVAPGELVELTALIDDTRFSTRNGIEPAQPIAAAEYYINVPPWDDTAVAYSMTAVDGSFNTTVEAVTGAIDTTGLSTGRHILYVRGQDANGNWGAVSAAFLYVLDPATAPVIAGYVRDANTSLPLDATVAAGIFQANTDPATGYYSMMVVGGTHRMQAFAAGYAASTVIDVVVPEGESYNQGFYLYPTCDIFADDVESGNPGWTAQGSWAITAESSHSPTRSWTDSPGGNYGNYWNYALRSPLFDLTGYSGVTLDFWHTYVLETGWDYGYLEISTNGGSTWSTIRTYNGEDQTTWKPESVPLPALDGQPNARFRFRLQTDSSVIRDGWHIDDIVLSGGGPGCPFEALAPEIEVSPPAVMLVMGTNETVTRSLAISNTGAAPLVWNLTADPAVSWLAATPVEGGVPSGAVAHVTLALIGPATPGTYTTTLWIDSDDPVTPLVSVPVTMQVRTPYDLVATPATAAHSGLPGAVVLYTFAVTNTGLYADVFSVTLTGGAWPVAAPAELGPLPAGESALLPVTATVSAAALCGERDVVTATLTSQGDPERIVRLALTTTAEAIYGVALGAGARAHSGDPGQDAHYTVTVTNTGNCADTFALHAAGDWPVAAPPTVGPLASGAGDVATVAVTIPEGQLAGALDTTTVRAVSQGDESREATLALTTTVNAVYAAALTPPALHLDGPPGTLVVYTFALSNTGNVTAAFALAVYDALWPISLIPTATVLGPGEATPVVVTTTIPSTATLLATDTGRLTVSGTIATLHSEFTTTALVRRAVALSATPATQGVAPGATASYVVSVTNTGNIADVFTVTVGGGNWPATFAPETVAVPPRETASVAVTVTAPLTAALGAWDAMTVTVTSQSEASISASLRLTTEAVCEFVRGAWFTYTPLQPMIGQTGTFTGSVEGGTPPVTFTWDFGDGGVGAGAVVTHTFPMQTVVLPYTVALTATNACSQDSVSRVIILGAHKAYLPLIVKP